MYRDCLKKLDVNRIRFNNQINKINNLHYLVIELSIHPSGEGNLHLFCFTKRLALTSNQK